MFSKEGAAAEKNRKKGLQKNLSIMYPLLIPALSPTLDAARAEEWGLGHWGR